MIIISVGKRLNFDFCKNGSSELNSTPLSSEKILKTGDEFLVIDKIAEKTSSPETVKIDISGINFIGCRGASSKRFNS